MHIFGIERINLRSSFCEGGAGFARKRVFSVDSDEVLNQSIWRIGCEAHDTLTKEIGDDYGEFIPEIIKNIEEYMEFFFTPFVLNAYKTGYIDASDLEEKNFEEVWRRQVIESKYLNM